MRETGLTDNEKELIRAMADHDMNVNAAARAMYHHRNSVIYHVEKIKHKTGLDPRRFYDLVSLIVLIDEEEDNGERT